MTKLQPQYAPTLGGIAKYAVAVLVVLALAQFAPELVNAFLILLLIGIVVMRYKYFQDLVNQITSLGK